MTRAIRVEVAYASADRQALRRLELPEGSSVADAVRASALAQEFPEIDDAGGDFAIYGRRVAGRTILRDLDRVEILRPLAADPKEIRRARARMKKPRGGLGG
jgi:uncharacterized protein